MHARIIVAASISGLIGGICSVTAIQMAAAFRRAASWPSAEGTVTESFLRTGPFQPSPWRTSVAYEFVASTKIRGIVIDTKIYGRTPRLSGDGFWGLNLQWKLVSKFPAGSKVKVYYDPRDPNKNCLDRDDKSGLYILSFVALGSFAIALVELCLGRMG